MGEPTDFTSGEPVADLTAMVARVREGVANGLSTDAAILLALDRIERRLETLEAVMKQAVDCMLLQSVPVFRRGPTGAVLYSGEPHLEILA